MLNAAVTAFTRNHHPSLSDVACFYSTKLQNVVRDLSRQLLAASGWTMWPLAMVLTWGFPSMGGTPKWLVIIMEIPCLNGMIGEYPFYGYGPSAGARIL